VTVELFGQRFRASVAAAELARASGCALLGVVVAREGTGYAARILPEFAYDRASLGSRESRQKLTQDIMAAFEPEIRRYPEQWFHFVPVWLGTDGPDR
jgi:lauroyl/myristoyl acyltransferase